jgi:hypothetical protein
VSGCLIPIGAEPTLLFTPANKISYTTSAVAARNLELYMETMICFFTEFMAETYLVNLNPAVWTSPSPRSTSMVLHDLA